MAGSGQKLKQAAHAGNTEKLFPHKISEAVEQFLPSAVSSPDVFQELAGSSPEQPGLNPWLTLP